jgi:hypothetical protein
MCGITRVERVTQNMYSYLFTFGLKNNDEFTQQFQVSTLFFYILEHSVYTTHTSRVIQCEAGGAILHALSGKLCNFKAAGLINPQNVTTPMITQTILVI